MGKLMRLGAKRGTLSIFYNYRIMREIERVCEMIEQVKGSEAATISALRSYRAQRDYDSVALYKKKFT